MAFLDILCHKSFKEKRLTEHFPIRRKAFITPPPRGFLSHLNVEQMQKNTYKNHSPGTEAH